MIEIGFAVALMAVNKASPVVIASEGVPAALNFCVESVTSTASGQRIIPENVTMFIDQPAAVFEKGSPQFRSFENVPELAKRFAKTQSMGGHGIKLFVSFVNPQADVWLVSYRSMPACDFFLTNSSDVPAQKKILFDALKNDGWVMTKTVEANGTNPLWKSLFVKRLPSKDLPDFGLRLVVRGLDETLAHKDGVQFEASLLAGEMPQLKIP